MNNKMSFDFRFRVNNYQLLSPASLKAFTTQLSHPDANESERDPTAVLAFY